MREVHAYLMGTTGFQDDLHEGMSPEPLDDRVVRYSGSAGFAYGHARAIDGVAIDSSIDFTPAGKNPVADSEVLAGYRAIRECPNQGGMRRQRLRDEQQSTGVFVQPMNDAGTRQRFQLRHMRQQAVHERTAGVPRARMHDQSGGLVDDQQIVVFEYDLERHGFGLGAHNDVSCNVQDDGLTALNRVARPPGCPIDEHRAVKQPCLEAAARIVGKHPGQRLVQSLTGQLVGDPCGMLGALFTHRRRGSLRYTRRFGSTRVDMIDFFNSPQFLARLQRRARQAILLTILAVLSACAGNEEAYDAVQDLQDAYDEAQTSIQNGNYRRGIPILEAIQARYPFSDIARQIQLDLMYAYYKSGAPELAIEAADTFIRENPIHPRVDYALYIEGLSYFDDDPGVLERWFRKDTNKRPPKNVEQAYQAFRRLVERYPASEYAPDAQQRMVYLKNRLAAYENSVADYYLRRGAYVAAANRAKSALETYNGADSNAQSLRIMIAAYEELGMNDLATDAQRVLELNFPDS